MCIHLISIIIKVYSLSKYKNVLYDVPVSHMLGPLQYSRTDATPLEVTNKKKKYIHFGTKCMQDGRVVRY